MRIILVLGLGGLLFAGSALADGDRLAGKKLAGLCRTCHGLDGVARLPIAPHIGGEPAIYLSAQLTAFRDGTRVHEMMSVIAQSLSDQQIADLAEWYSGHIAIAAPETDMADAPDACVACHGADGIAKVEDAPNLAGETNIYIETQLKAFRSGRRTHDVMTSIAAGLTDAEIREVADWYASIGLVVTMVE